MLNICCYLRLCISDGADCFDKGTEKGLATEPKLIFADRTAFLISLFKKFLQIILKLNLKHYKVSFKHNKHVTILLT